MSRSLNRNQYRSELGFLRSTSIRGPSIMKARAGATNVRLLPIWKRGNDSIC